MTAARCRACRRALRHPSPDGYGPVCRRRLAPSPGQTPGHTDRPEPGPGQTAIPVPAHQPSLWSL